ncbi:MAG: arginine--tRNA ligase, partial [Woeseiaceae bacterium]
MKHIVAQLVTDALANLPELADAAADLSIESTVERTRDASHGDFATNIAMRLAKPARRSPREIAASIVATLADNADVDKVDIAGPGFINFHLSSSAFHAELEAILQQGEKYGRQARKDRPKILLEFVSANPTGPLHVGHGRGASFGATVGNLLEAVGYPVHREYYVNDAGRQMDILGVSVWLRMLEKNGIAVGFPQGGYRGGYIRDIAATINTDGVTSVSAESVLADLPADAPEGDKETYVEALIGRARTLLGEAGFDHVRQQSLE